MWVVKASVQVLSGERRSAGDRYIAHLWEQRFINWTLVPAVPRQTLTIYYLHLGDHPSQLPPRRTAGVNVIDCVPETFLHAFFLFLTLILSLCVLLPYTLIDTPTLRIREHVLHFVRMQILCASFESRPLSLYHANTYSLSCWVYSLCYLAQPVWLVTKCKRKDYKWLLQWFYKTCQTYLLECFLKCPFPYNWQVI